VDCACERNIHLGDRGAEYLQVWSLLRAGGFSAPPVGFHRDLAVCTSARVSRRVRGGFSDYLSRPEGRPAVPTEASRLAQAA
jgi:hypothetical protein